MPEYLTEKEAAQLLKVSADTLARFRRAGEGPPYVKVGRRVRYIKESIDAWVKAQERGNG